MESIWTNPAVLGVDPEGGIIATGIVAFRPSPGAADTGLRQGILGARVGPVSVALRRDRFRIEPGDEDPEEGTGITIGLGLEWDRFALGLANDQYRRGLNSSRWQVGGLWRPGAVVSLGLSWRDITSPVVVAEEQPWELLGGATVHLPDAWGNVSLEGVLRDGNMERYRATARVQLPVGVDLLALTDVDRGGSLAQLRVGLGYRFGNNRVFGIAGRDSSREPGSTDEYVLGGTRVF